MSAESIENVEGDVLSFLFSTSCSGRDRLLRAGTDRRVVKILYSQFYVPTEMDKPNAMKVVDSQLNIRILGSSPMEVQPSTKTPFVPTRFIFEGHAEECFALQTVIKGNVVVIADQLETRILEASMKGILLRVLLVYLQNLEEAESLLQPVSNLSIYSNWIVIGLLDRENLATLLLRWVNARLRLQE
ncbi:hypothetical protein M406DRAFT_335297 [Cryphonectria parasitica EP155]|uniref:Uncharacterized protein n=1 Tax=Cryphonectria parasitica (strain ATCC 38755 / EP155) TaxID=660469 RepID=A0A9P5CJE6_CRYP1|nr:uncharacterized protein M406DRAFT_335297 [Cryphonectria parasitica EP155]KAF3760097.1 hypothetical protein M406DRAFT_335297 [Cryphonectria parasitica EP155]